MTLRITEASHAKFEYIRSISKENGSTIAQMKAIERDCVAFSKSPDM